MKRMALFLILAVAGSTQAQEQGKLTLAAAVHAALAADPVIGAATADVAAARAVTREAESARKPHLDLGGSILRYEEPMVVTPIHGFTPGQLPEFDETLIQSNLTASYLLYDRGAARARIRQSEAGEGAAEASLDSARAAIAARTAASYLIVLSQAASLQAHDLRKTALESELARVRQLLDVGRAANVEVLRVEAALAAAAAERTTTAANLEVAERSLALLTGLPESETRVFNLDAAAMRIPSVGEREPLQRAAVESNANVRQARQRALAQRAAISFARAGNGPRLLAVGSLLEFGSAEGSFALEWNTGLQVRWSVFDGGATGARVAQALAAAERAEQQIRIAERDARDAVDRALAEIEQARANAESLGTAVERFAEVVRVEKLRLDAGVGTQTDYLRAEADLMQARAGLAVAQYRTMIAAVEIARITGEISTFWSRP
jgi:outer membrane protein TolC